MTKNIFISMICIRPNSIIYVYCPANVAGGGAEALHQLCYYLNNCGFTSKIVYYGLPTFLVKTNERYLKYNTLSVDLKNVNDDEFNVFITPESSPDILYFFKRIQRCIWWLGGRTYFQRLEKGKNNFKRLCKIFKYRDLFKYLYRKNYERKYITRRHKIVDEGTKMFAASYYAEELLANLGGKCSRLIEPLGLEFLEIIKNHTGDSFSSKGREPVVLYNPNREMEHTTRIIKKLELIGIRCVPIVGLSTKQIIELMYKSRVYIDFGEFPGAERIPKEAAICGLCIVVRKIGASENYNDVVIEDKYKFKNPDTEIDIIVDTIVDCIENYDIKIFDFQKYRETIRNLENQFIQQIRKIFGDNNVVR